MPRELAACVERANLDPEVHVIALAGNGTGFCGGYDLVASGRGHGAPGRSARGAGGLADSIPWSSPATTTRTAIWDPVTDYQMMSRNVRGFMSLFHSEKPVVCKVHGYCVAGGTDMALCSDLLGDRGRGEDRLSAGARLGRADDGAVGVPDRPGPRQAAAADRRLALRERGARVGARDRGARRRPSSTRAVRGAARAGRPGADQPARDAQAARQPGALRRRACRRRRCSGRSSTGSPATRPRATTSSARRPRRASSEAVRERDEPFGDFGLGGVTGGGPGTE